ncbi:MAG: hypothetical protein ISS48_04300 [Candidatus Aenigmarchaeota archaeon]|nr:hypothetical protein [Candidatus Aenigmarchaeota archaeon]
MGHNKLVPIVATQSSLTRPKERGISLGYSLYAIIGPLTEYCAVFAPRMEHKCIVSRLKSIGLAPSGINPMREEILLRGAIRYHFGYDVKSRSRMFPKFVNIIMHNKLFLCMSTEMDVRLGSIRDPCSL